MIVRTGSLLMLFNFVPIRVFRAAPQVSFFGAGVNGEMVLILS